jgi:DNA gyrase subunit B
LNSGSNIDSSNKADLKTNTLGRNGVGTIAMTALGARTEVTTYRGKTEGVCRNLIFEEGKQISAKTLECNPNMNGLKVKFIPSKILGKNTRIVWKMIRDELVNIQFNNEKKIKIHSTYIDKNNKITKEDYKVQSFENIISYKNNKSDLISSICRIDFEDNNFIEEFSGKKYKRNLQMTIAFAYSKSTPYIDSFCNRNNTIDNGSHLDGSIEGICRYFQNVVKNSLTNRDKIEIKWDDIKTGLSIAVALNTNIESIFTSQTKHKVSNDDLEKVIKDKTIEALDQYFKKNDSKLKEFIGLIKLNAKARREGERAKSSILKETMTNWSAYKMKHYDPCSNKGKEYKELYIIEGDSAKGSLKLSRDPKFQALFAIRGVSANVFKLDLKGILENKEFNDLIKVMGCNVGTKFDLNRLQFNKIIIASDADVDGLFIRSLLCSFFFKVFPEIIRDGRLFIAEPPLYKVDNKSDPFVINKEDYINRYIERVVKDYKIEIDNEAISKTDLYELIADTVNYVDDIDMLAKHYNINDRLIEIILEEIANENTKGS